MQIIDWIESTAPRPVRISGIWIADECMVALVVDSTNLFKTLNLVWGEEVYALFNRCIGDVFADVLLIFRHAGD